MNIKKLFVVFFCFLVSSGFSMPTSKSCSIKHSPNRPINPGIMHFKLNRPPNFITNDGAFFIRYDKKEFYFYNDAYVSKDRRFVAHRSDPIGNLCFKYNTNGVGYCCLRCFQRISSSKEIRNHIRKQCPYGSKHRVH